MRLAALFFLTVLYLLPVYAGQVRGNMLVDEHLNALDTLVNLSGKDAFTKITNYTADTLRLSGTVFYYLPVSEQSFQLTVAPGQTKLLKTRFYYPDFILFNSIPLRIYNSPGKTVQCAIESLTPLKVVFSGDLSAENKYYQAYFSVWQDNQVYYQAGAKLKNFDKFPAIADSVNRINLAFLSGYKAPIPALFKTYEYWRLKYNNAFLKYHVLFDKQFKAGYEITVDDQYYHFEAGMPLINKDATLSTAYLWYAVFRLRRQALMKSKIDSMLTPNMISAADSVYQNNEMGDVLKMRFLYDAYPHSDYYRLLKHTRFVNPANKQILDSVRRNQFSLPLVGSNAPGFKLPGIDKDTVSLHDFAGHPVIINFWASWCAPCIKEFPFENELYNLYKHSKDLIVINICVDSTPEEWQHLSAQHHLQMINLYANQKQYSYFKKVYGLSALPRSVFIDRDLKVTDNNFKRASQLKEADIGN